MGKFLVLFTALMIMVCLPGQAVFASQTDGTVSGYAWSSQIGWINFGTDNGNVHITDSGMTGYAWNENMGRVKLNPANSGVANNSEGTLSGKAWCEGTGWINFSGVTVSSSGVFSGTATGDNSVNINFGCANCNVTTDWRPASSRSSGGGGGGGSVSGGGSPLPPVIPEPPPSSGSSDTTPPYITITVIKGSYLATEQVLVLGTTEPGAGITFLLDNSYGSLQPDSFGNWFLPAGILPVGNHRLEMVAKDAAGNTSSPAVAVFSVYAPPVVYQPPPVDIFKKIIDGIGSLFPGFFQPKKPPTAIVTVPKIAPPAFKGEFHYIPTTVLAKLVLRPLPSDVQLLAQKFPQVQKTFNEVGVTKITDLQKLSNANLSLPNLTETVLPKPTLAVGKFAVPKGVPIERLSAIAKTSIPSEIVFAKAAGGLVDLNVALSINNQGKPIQTIKMLSSQNLQLVVRTEQEVEKISGYVAFKSRKQTTAAVKSDLNAMSASLLFGNPSLAALAGPNIQIPIEGAGNGAGDSEASGQPDVEKRFVISRFEYQDSGHGVYTATIQTPVVDGEYEIITMIDYRGQDTQEKEIKLVTLIDPEGYIYEKSGDKETRIAGAIASLYWLNPQTKQYELWPAKDFQQENPQTTDVRGTYSFLVPDGYYYLKVDAPGYLSYDGKPFEVKEGSGIHINIEMKTKYWFLSIVDWKTLLLIVVILLLLYNFYRDKVRDRQKNSMSAEKITT